MARQSSTPVQFNKTTRGDRVVGQTSGRAGVVYPVDYIPVLRGDSASGRFYASIDLAEMPKPLRNAVRAKFQAWFVPYPAFPHFAGYDDFLASYQGETIRAVGQTDRTPPAFFPQFAEGADLDAFESSEFLRKMGLHLKDGTAAGQGHNAFLVDAMALIWNFRARSHSNRIPLRKYVAEDPAAALEFAPAFWPSSKFRNVVPDYERALVLGALDLDVAAGLIPVDGITRPDNNVGAGAQANVIPEADKVRIRHSTSLSDSVVFDIASDGTSSIFANMAGQTVATTLAGMDKARTTQVFAKLRAAYAGVDHTGYNPENAIIAEMMQGFSVPDDMFKRPWLLDSREVTFGMQERHASDGASLDQSVSKGMAMAGLSLNLPKQDSGGIIMITCEVLPEQMHERQGDPYLHASDIADFPNALRDTQRPEPVDFVQNWRIDERHTDPDALYGFEPMNARWDRDFHRLGGDFYQDTPGAAWTEARAAIWQVKVVDPEFTANHYIAPDNFPHDVFADTTADAFELTFRHDVALRGITQIGDPLVENNDEFEKVKEIAQAALDADAAAAAAAEAQGQ